MSEISKLAVEDGKSGAILRVHVQPRASREGMRLSEDGRLRVSVTAPPVDDAANTAVRVFLAKILKVARRDVTIMSGEQSRNKTVCIANISAQKALETIGENL